MGDLMKVGGYSNKWYTKEEWGGTPSIIRANAKQYVEAFAATFCPTDLSRRCLVDVLEIGNEPWGEGESSTNPDDDTPGVEGYHCNNSRCSRCDEGSIW